MNQFGNSDGGGGYRPPVRPNRPQTQGVQRSRQPYPGGSQAGNAYGQQSRPNMPSMPSPFPKMPFPGMGGGGFQTTGPFGSGGVGQGFGGQQPLVPQPMQGYGQLPIPIHSSIQSMYQQPMTGIPGMFGGGQAQYGTNVQPMQGYGQQSSLSANRLTGNPYMPQPQQPLPQPQQMPNNPYNPYQSSQGWNQPGRFPGGRFPAY